MRKLLHATITVVVLSLAISLICHYDATRLHVYVSEKSPDGSKVAEIVWKCESPFIKSWLIVEDLEGDSIVLKYSLYGGFDTPSNVAQEFGGLSWDGNTIRIDVKGHRYRGPVSFVLK